MVDKKSAGECNCAAVAFELTDVGQGVFVCHCSICRRLTGSNGIAVVVVKNEGFRWIRGEGFVSNWQKPGHDWISSFCSVCGSTLPVINDESSMAVPAGLLSHGDKGLAVIHHLWVDSKAGWDEIGDSGQQHCEAFRG